MSLSVVSNIEASIAQSEERNISPVTRSTLFLPGRQVATGQVDVERGVHIFMLIYCLLRTALGGRVTLTRFQ